MECGRGGDRDVWTDQVRSLNPTLSVRTSVGPEEPRLHRGLSSGEMVVEQDLNTPQRSVVAFCSP